VRSLGWHVYGYVLCIDGCFYPFEVGGISSPSLNSDAEIS